MTQKYDFLECEDGAELFSQLVDALKKGAHIQYEGDKKLFLYLEKYIDNLTVYFKRHENITIVPSGSGNDSYYFPLYHPVSRSNYSVERSSLPKEHILIALLLYKAYYIDHNIELTSVKKFVALISRSMCNVYLSRQKAPKNVLLNQMMLVLIKKYNVHSRIFIS